MPTRLRAASSQRGIIDLEVVVATFLARSQPGFTWDTATGCVIALRPEIVVGLRASEAAAMHVVMHEFGHATLHSGRYPRPEDENEANVFATAVLALLKL